MLALLARLANRLRRCWSCSAPLGAKDRFCLRCGAKQRDPAR